MNVSKLLCPRCGKKVFGLDEEEEKVSDTDEMDIPLFAPSWDEEDLWQQDPYYELKCSSGHISVVFEKSGEIADLKAFHKIMDKKEEEYLYKTILKSGRYSIKSVFIVAPVNGKAICIATDKSTAFGEAKKLNEWVKRDPKRFTVSEISIADIQNLIRCRS